MVFFIARIRSPELPHPLTKTIIDIDIIYNAGKCNLTELTTRSTSFTSVASGLLLCTCARIPRALEPQSIVAFGWRFSQRFSRVSVSPERGDSLESVSPPLSLPFPFHCFSSVAGACFFSFCMGAHGWVPWICQPWERSPSRSWLPVVEAPDVSGTQPPLCEAVVNKYFPKDV